MGIPTTKVSFKAPTFRRLRIKIDLKSVSGQFLDLEKERHNLGEKSKGYVQQ